MAPLMMERIVWSLKELWGIVRGRDYSAMAGY